MIIKASADYINVGYYVFFLCSIILDGLLTTRVCSVEYE
jgi:hypothetical protein